MTPHPGLCHQVPGPGWDPAAGGACPQCAHPWLAHAGAATCLLCVQMGIATVLMLAGQQIAAITAEGTGPPDPLAAPTMGEAAIAELQARQRAAADPPG